MQDTTQARAFTGKVAGLFGGQVFRVGIGVVNGILLAKLLGPAGKGDYALIVLIPSTLLVLLQLGLPQAFAFYAARGRTLGMLPKTFVLTALLSLIAFAALFVILPLLQQAILHGIALSLVVLGLLVLPPSLHATFTTGVVTGRQGVRWLVGVKTASSIVTLLLLVAIVGGLNAYVFGAVVVFLVTAIVQAMGMAVGAQRLSDATPSSGRISYRELFRFGLPQYVGSLTTHFSYRIDTYVIAFMLADPSAPLGYYSMAVTMAEMVFIFPSAVQTIFFPHVAGSDRADANRQVTQVSRVTLLVSMAAALFVACMAAVLFQFVLPAFAQSMQPLLVLLPAVVTLSVSNVTEGYVTGIGRPGVSSSIGVVSFLVNVVANVLLIPRLGIVGAATASLLSYTLSSVLMTIVAGRFSGQRVWDFWVPRRDDIRIVVRMSLALLGRVWDGLRVGRGGRGAA